MTPHQALTVAVRLFAIWLAVVLMRDTVRFFIFDAPHVDLQTVAYAMAGLVFFLGFCLLLWLFPKSVAHKLLPPPVDVPQKPSAPDTWIGVGVALIGLWLAITAFSALTGNAVALYSVVDPQRAELAALRRSFVYLFVDLLVGLLMIVGAGAIRRFVVWLRYAGTG